MLTISGLPGSFHTLLSASKLEGNQGWHVLTNVTLDGVGHRRVQLSSTDGETRFYKRFAPEGLVGIPPGTFVMGSPLTEKERFNDEDQHTVILTRGFWMGQLEVTQGEYLSVIGSNPSYFQNGVRAVDSGTGGIVTNDLRHPVEQVSWDDATNYCGKLTQRSQASGVIPKELAYRLPTEAEWEYACRAGTTSAFSFGTAIRQAMASFDAQEEYDSAVGSQSKPGNVLINRTIEGGSFAPNAFGLYDMHGSVWEWCSDFYENYSTVTVTDPTGRTSGGSPVHRGGCWHNYGGVCRAARRFSIYPGFRNLGLGFRVVLAPAR